MHLVDIPVIAILMIAVVAAVTDVRMRRIPNLLTFGSAAVAFAFAATTAGWNGLALSAAGWLIGAALFFPFFAVGGMGAGDVKLLAALGAWLGPADVVWLAIFAAMAGGIAGGLVALRHRYLRQALTNVWLIVTHWRVCGFGAVPGLTLSDDQAPRIAYAIPILIGAMVTVWRG
jgi:prepilin peptidase CpaA